MTTVLEYVETTPKALLKPKITVKRTTQSKYLLYLLIRHYRQALNTAPVFVTYTKAESNWVRGVLEEISVFRHQDFYVLEGFPLSFVEGLQLPAGTTVIAEVDDGELETPPYSYKEKRNLLKVLKTQLGLLHSLRDLVNLDWGSVRDYPEVEVILRRALIAGWTTERLSKELVDAATGNILLLLRRGNLQDLMLLRIRYGPLWMVRHLTRTVSQLAVFRALTSMGQSQSSIGETLGLSRYKLMELDEAAKAVTNADLQVLGQRIVNLDRLVMTKQEFAADLLLLRSGISLKR